MLKTFSNISISKGVFQSLLTIFGSLIASGFSALSLILIGRYLGPERFGEFSVGFAILLILVRLNDLGMTNIVQRYAAQESDTTKINRIFSLATKIRLIGAGIIIVVGLLSSQWLASVMNFPQPTIIYLAFILSTATTFYEHFQAMLQSLHKFVASSLVNILQAVAKFIGALILTVVTNGATLPIFSWYVFAPAIPVFLFSLFLPKWVQIHIQQDFSVEFDRIKKLTLHSSIAIIAAGIIENIDVLFVQSYLNTYEAGLLGGVSRIALLFSIAAYALSSVLNPRVAKYQDKQHLISFIKKGTLLALISMFGFLVFVPFSQLILHFTIGDQYLPALGILNILVAASFLTVALVPFIALFFSFDNPYYFSLSGILQLLIIIAGNMIFVPLYGLEATAWTRLVSRIVVFIFTIVFAYYAFKKTYDSRTN